MEYQAAVFVILSTLFTSVGMAGILSSIINTEAEYVLLAAASFALALTGLYFYKKDS